MDSETRLDRLGRPIFRTYEAPRLTSRENVMTFGSRVSENGRQIPVNVKLQNSLAAELVPTAYGTIGVIRIYNFAFLPMEEFELEFIRVLNLMPRNGLVLDIRGNDGGFLYLSQAFVQMFTRERVATVKLKFRTTPLMLKLLDEPVTNRTGELKGNLDLYRRSASIANQVGDQFFGGFEEDDNVFNRYTGKQYDGPVIVLIDGETYSGGDLFAAVCQDNGAARIVGVDDRTGGGGSNTAPYRGFFNKASPKLFPALPGNVDFRTSVQRADRVRNNSGMVLEYFGVKADARYYPTFNDRLRKDRDMYNALAQSFVEMKNTADFRR